MNNYFSYIDTSLRIVYFNIHLSGSKENIKNYRRNLLLFENSKKIKNQFIQKHLKKVEESDINFYKLRVHEFHHYWQSIFYPFLFWLSYTEYNTLLGFSSQLKNVKQKVKIRQFGMDEDSLSNIGYLHYTFKLAWDSKIGLTHEYDNYVTVGINRFCLNDLIETATAIYQFKITEKDHDFNSFWYWVRNPKNKAYSKLYCFLNQYTDKEILFDIFPICVQLAFNTTEPVSAFCLLYNSYEYYYKKNAKDNLQIAREYLQMTFPKLDIKLLDYNHISKLPVTYIDFKTYREFVNQTSSFPISIHATKYLDLLENNTEHEYYWPNKVGYYDTLLLSNEKQSQEYLLKHFYPLCIFYNFLDVHGRDNCSIFSEEAVNNTHIFNNNVTVDSSEFLMEITKLKDVLLSLYNDFNKKLPKYCHHVDCKYYNIDICRRWNSIPAQKENCLFPSWFSFYFEKIIDIEKEELIPITQKQLIEIKNEGEEIRERIDFLTKYNYVFNENIYILDISKNVILKNDTEYLLDFILYQANSKNSIESMINALVLDFSEYADDERSVFQIPEIKDWINHTYECFPYIPLFLNFSDKSYNQSSFILPCFIEHSFLKLENKEFEIELDKDSYIAFINKTLIYIIDYCNHLKINNEVVAEQFIKNINYNYGTYN